MSEKILVVVDMQNDFVTGSLGSAEASQILKPLTEKIKAFSGTVVYTKDTHSPDYLNTQEGQKLPIEHCIENTAGWQLVPELAVLQKAADSRVYTKPSFGSLELARELLSRHQQSRIEAIELVGVCTDICVISNALLLKAYLPEVEITVDGSCCAGSTPEKHLQALAVMESCQIIVTKKAV